MAKNKYLKRNRMSQTLIENVHKPDSSANPAPLGLLGFGMTTILLNLHNAGFFPLNAMIMAMGLFVGGLAQLIAGILESKKGNTFGMTAFVAYGCFWLSLVAIWLLPKLAGAAVADETAMAWYLLLWGIFTCGLFVGTFRISRALQVVFGSLTLLFLLLAARDFLVASGIEAGKTIGLAAGWVGLACGLSAVYAGLAQVLNEVYGKTVYPLGTTLK